MSDADRIIELEQLVQKLQSQVYILSAHIDAAHTAKALLEEVAHGE